jgi:RecG-like helicase
MPLKRIETMVANSSDGFEIAEVDLELTWTGRFSWVRNKVDY